VWPRSARVERPFPTLSIPWVWSLSTWLASWLCAVQKSFYFSLRKAVTSQLPPLVVTLWLSFSFFQDFVSFIMWCIQLTTFIVRYQSCMCVFPFTFRPQHHDFVWNHSPLFSSCVSQLASLFSSQHGIREPYVVIRAVVQHYQHMLLFGLSSFFRFWCLFFELVSHLWEKRCSSLKSQRRNFVCVYEMESPWAP